MIGAPWERAPIQAWSIEKAESGANTSGKVSDNDLWWKLHFSCSGEFCLNLPLEKAHLSSRSRYF